MITVDNLSLYVLNNLSSIESLAAFVAFMRNHIEYYTVEGLSEILAKLTDICYRLHGDIDYELYLSVKQNILVLFKNYHLILLINWPIC